MYTELARVIRHGVPPLVAYAVASGWIPVHMQQPIIEAGIAIAAVVASLAASRARDKSKT